MDRPIDLRSDTVTQPSHAMRRAMADARVGDDQFGEDPSVNRLEATVAELLGKEAAVWLPTGVMANQVALRTLTRPGDDVVVSPDSHIMRLETGAAAANSGVQFTIVGESGRYTAGQLAAVIKPRGHIAWPPTTVAVVENTHNMAGGIVVPPADLEAIGRTARERQVATFLDGARLWNAAVALRVTPAALAAPFDLTSVALSKGLGAPAGSLLAGSAELIAGARRYRRMMGGAMRQVGILAAAGSHALETNRERLADDHAHARLLAERLARSDRIRLDLDSVQTNIVLFHLADRASDAATFVARAGAQGVKLFAFGPRTLRAVTHLDVTRDECVRAADIFHRIAEGEGG